MKFKTLAAAVILAAAAFTACAPAAPPTDLSAHPIPDKAAIVRDVGKIKKCLLKTTGQVFTEEELTAQTDALVSDIENDRADAYDVTYRLRKILGSYKNVHMGLSIPDENSPYYPWHEKFPIQAKWFGDKFIVTKANDSDVIGAEIIGFENLTLDEAMSKLSTIYSDETEMHMRAIMQNPLYVNNFKYSGVTDSDELSVSLLRPDGKKIAKTLAPVDENSELEFSADNAKTGETLREQQLSANDNAPYFYYIDEKNRAFCFVYYECCNATDAGYDGVPAFDDFLADMTAQVNIHKDDFDTFVVDFRDNPGGNANLLMPLFEKYYDTYMRLKISVLVDKTTYSSGTMGACRFKQFFPNTTIYGEETAEAVDLWGDFAEEKLGTGFVMRYSTSTIDYLMPDTTQDRTRGIIPDVPVINTYEDYLAGIDRVYETSVK